MAGIHQARQADAKTAWQMLRISNSGTVFDLQPGPVTVLISRLTKPGSGAAWIPTLTMPSDSLAIRATGAVDWALEILTIHHSITQISLFILGVVG